MLTEEKMRQIAREINREYYRQYREKNRKRINERAAIYRAEHPDRIKAAQAKHRAKKKEARNACTNENN